MANITGGWLSSSQASSPNAPVNYTTAGGMSSSQPDLPYTPVANTTDGWMSSSQASLPNTAVANISTREMSSSLSVNHLSPSDFPVDGEPISFSPKPPKIRKSRNALVTDRRNCGKEYRTEKTNRHMKEKRNHIGESKCTFCSSKGLFCKDISSEERQTIRRAYYDMASLHHQREWISRYVSVNTSGKSLGKNRSLNYFLPKSDTNHHKLKVCRQVFISTIGVSDKQITTVLQKVNEYGVMDGERRGGRQTAEKDQILRDQVQEHINRFPRMESHYCRANSSYQYLSSDLNFSIMYEMYKKENPSGASIGLYKSVFKSLHLKFHHPKKDMCGLCETYFHSTAEKKQELQKEFDRHYKEKVKVREIKSKSKERASNDISHRAAVFDLQQVIYLPKSSRSELFYKRRLACYNLTIYELASKEGICFVSHEGLTRRGSCEIASYLHKYLSNIDEQGVQHVDLFSDGCIGQNKNSVLPAMLLSFVCSSRNVQEVTMHFFETSHGQSEGDSMHSSIERVINQVEEISVPSQLVSICKMARKDPRPYVVIPVSSADISDWKSFSQRQGILRVRTSEDGKTIDWTKFMQIRVCKGEPHQIEFKYSHLDVSFSAICIRQTRRTSDTEPLQPLKLYQSGNPKISAAKYKDLHSLCTGKTPVLFHPDYQDFYLYLPH